MPRQAGLPACPPLAPVIGHRGAAAYAPENTLAGLRRAHEFGCRWVEFDVRLNADGALVLCHDSRVDRTTDGKGRVADLKLTELCRLDAGSWFAPGFAGERMPTLGDALAVGTKLGIDVNIEMKADRGRARATARAVAECLGRGRGRPSSASPVRGPVHSGDPFGDDAKKGTPAILVSSFDLDALAEFRAVNADVPTGLLLKSVPRTWRTLAVRLGCTTINVAHARLQPHLVDEISAAGYPVLAYTVNDPARAATLFDWGVTSVFSDAPDIILAMIASDGEARPHQGTGAPEAVARQGNVA
jgi:glycerophosphoryl diester phosphodiesterase